jgi:murein peptide amidase A
MTQAAKFSWTPVLAALLLLSGTSALFLVFRGPRDTVAVAGETIGYSVEGRPIDVFSFGRGPRPVLIMASIHGTEGAGTPLTRQLMQWLSAHPEALGRRVLVLPAANPDGLHRAIRFNLRGVDLNRNFPAENREDKARFGYAALSEPESRAFHAYILKEQPEWIVSIHQPLECIDYDGPAPAAELAAQLSRATGLPVEKLGARPGSLGAWFGETLGRPVLTMELPRRPVEDPQRLWERYGPGLLEIAGCALPLKSPLPAANMVPGRAVISN